MLGIGRVPIPVYKISDEGPTYLLMIRDHEKCCTLAGAWVAGWSLLSAPCTLKSVCAFINEYQPALLFSQYVTDDLPRLHRCCLSVTGRYGIVNDSWASPYLSHSLGYIP
ncbi:hypothetical protein M752DRAFT_58297 [Aspergillus phoenicis ATCC 13157]|uniref:Uncharacterized protein n=2 Tax=Aspergillus TaxID=5052 RepID=A0A370P9Z4_ASPPH|nr:hypothetical protein M747DRAFT_175252 [Aspergillus niger ATCC 13496]RDK38992.1 hypothetical protein M752DRAFT_58297 [Aspergillus phoenicis ATCC 13157]